MRVPFSTKFFTWIHTPKTGGTWIHQIIKRTAPESWQARTTSVHVRLAEFEELMTAAKLGHRVGLPKIATVRNPWDWYVSLYFYMEQHRISGTGGFSVPIPKMTPGCKVWKTRFTKGLSAAGFQEALPDMLRALHDEKNYAVVPPQSEFIRGADGNVGIEKVVRFENLRHDFIEALESTGAEIPRGMRSRLMESKKKNTSSHPHYSCCYDENSKKLVAKYEGWTIDTFGYVFEPYRR